MMSEILAQIYTDHLRVSRLLDLLEVETNKVEGGELANYPLMALIMDYISHYPDLNHHPLEDQIFAKLVEKDGQYAALVEQLRKEHQEMPVSSKRIADLLASIAGEAIISRGLLIEECRRYIRLSLAHMHKEETEILPLAEQRLDEADWAKVAETATLADDPLFGQTVIENYHTLYDMINLYETVHHKT